MNFPPQRIISLCPSLTETLYELGLEERIVGRTRFCIHPSDKVGGAYRVGGTKQIHMDRVHDLKPDLIIAEKEENTQEMVRELSEHYPVYVGDVRDISGAFDMISSLGKVTDTEVRAEKMLDGIKQEYQQLTPSQPIKVAYFIWKDPLMVVGADTYIHEVMGAMGWDNIFGEWPGRYPTLQLHNTQEPFDADWVWLSSEPYPFKEAHVPYFQKLFPNAQIQIVDGEMFSWYGSRMKVAFPYLRELQHKIDHQKPNN